MMVKKKSKASGKKRKHFVSRLGAIELSMTTIVIIVISIIVLIFGIIFAKNIMCSGIRVTDQIDTAVKNQLRDLFGADKIGVSCQGEEGQDVKVGTGKRVSIVCQIKVDEPANYKILVDDPMILLGGEKTKLAPKSWILSKGVNDVGVKPGTITYQPIIFLNVPSDAGKSTVQLNLKVYDKNDPTGSYETHTLVFDIVPLNFVQTTLC
jgi:hypothetical protein